MSKEGKQAVKTLRREIREKCRPLIMRRMGLYATNGQIEAAIRQFVDGYLANLKRMQRTVKLAPISETP